tara:strand:+ start:5541 stop:5831 length:291 start_codon:yes stop_codon:yes gene_type:complete
LRAGRKPKVRPISSAVTQAKAIEPAENIIGNSPSAWPKLAPTTSASPSLPADYTPFDAAEVGILRQQDVGNAVKYRRVVVDKLESMGLTAADYPWP